MSSQLVGTWNVESSTNWEDYMKALGVGFAMRKIGASLKPTVTISNNGDQWAIKVTSTFKNTEINFEVGKEFQEETLDGRKCKSTVTSEGPNKFVQVQRDAETGEASSTITREVNAEGKLVQTLVAHKKDGDVTATRVYTRS